MPAPQQQPRQRKPPSITPRRFTRFFTPRTDGIRGGGGATRRVLFDLAGSTNSRNGIQSSPIRRPIPETAQENELPPLAGDNKRRKLTHEPIVQAEASFSTLYEAALNVAQDAMPNLNGFGDLETTANNNNIVLSSFHSQSIKESWSLTKSIPRPNVKPVRRLQNTGLHASLLTRELGLDRSGWAQPIGDWEDETAGFFTKPEDIHECNSIATPLVQSMTIPFCVQGLNQSNHFAVGDEQGFVRILDSDIRRQPNLTKWSIAFRPHANAVIDMTFSQDDSLLATASGDQTGSIINMETQKTMHKLTGHTASLKQIRFQPGMANNSILATSGRDGSVQVWDLRCRSSQGPVVQMHMPPAGEESSQISYAHALGRIELAHNPSDCVWSLETKKDSRTSSRQQDLNRSNEDRSVTAIQFLPEGKEHLLLTASNQSAAIKLWDIRAIGSLRQRQVQALSQTAQPLSHKGYRDFGISSMTLSGDGSRLFTVCRDNTIYAYSTEHLILGSAPELTDPTDRHRYVSETSLGLGPMYGYRHSALRVGSFFVKASIRPARYGKSELLAVGNSDGSTIVIPTDTRYLPYQTPQNSTDKSDSKRKDDCIPIHRNATALIRGSEKEVSAVAWTSAGDLITTDDDCVVRRWGEGLEEARDLRTGGEGQGRRWKCGWADAREGYDEEFDC